MKLWRHRIDLMPRRILAFWVALVGAIFLLTLGMRYQAIASADCHSTLRPTASGVARDPQTNASVPGSVLHTSITFDWREGRTTPAALTIGRALPFYRLMLNGADLTPGVDLAARDIRDRAPHLHVLPAELLQAHDNRVELQFPDATMLGSVNVNQVCIGRLADMQPAFRANWWRMVGVARVCLLLLISFALLALALWLLGGRPRVHLWYVALLLPLMLRNFYDASTSRPGGPVPWMYLEAVGSAALPYLLFGFMRAHWRFCFPRLALVLKLLTAMALLLIGVDTIHPAPFLGVTVDNGLTFLVLTSTLVAVTAVLMLVRSMHRVERRAVLAAASIAIACSTVQAANAFFPFAQRWMWTDPIASVALAIGFGYLLIRRMAVGEFVYTSASAALACELDEAIAVEPLPNHRLWSRFSAGIGRGERSRLMRDIHDGFGSRLVGVLALARRELAHFPLLNEIHRALLDMRLMIDAMDETSASLACALARFRQRIEQAHAAASERCAWHVRMASDVVIGEPTRLVAALRALEELLHEALERAHRGAIEIDVQAVRRSIRFAVVGGSGWSAHAIDRIHRLIRPMDGEVVLRNDDAQPRCEFSVPTF